MFRTPMQKTVKVRMPCAQNNQCWLDVVSTSDQNNHCWLDVVFEAGRFQYARTALWVTHFERNLSTFESSSFLQDIRSN